MSSENSVDVHEALDRAFMQSIFLQQSLGEHPVVQNNSELKRLYEQAVSNLGELYQKLGELSVG